MNMNGPKLSTRKAFLLFHTDFPPTHLWYLLDPCSGGVEGPRVGSRHAYYLSLTAIHFGTPTFMQRDTFQCMINHEQILFFHLRVMESQMWQSTKRNILFVWVSVVGHALYAHLPPPNKSSWLLQVKFIFSQTITSLLTQDSSFQLLLSKCCSCSTYMEIK